MAENQLQFKLDYLNIAQNKSNMIFTLFMCSATLNNILFLCINGSTLSRNNLTLFSFINLIFICLTYYIFNILNNVIKYDEILTLTIDKVNRKIIYTQIFKSFLAFETLAVVFLDVVFLFQK